MLFDFYELYLLVRHTTTHLHLLKNTETYIHCNNHIWMKYPTPFCLQMCVYYNIFIKAKIGAKKFFFRQLLYIKDIYG